MTAVIYAAIHLTASAKRHPFEDNCASHKFCRENGITVVGTYIDHLLCQDG